MGRYVGNKWHEELPSTSPADQTQGNNEPVNNAPSQRGGGGGGFVAPATTGGGGGSAGFWTKNGYQTVATMAQQLQANGWGGNPGDAVSVIDAYRRTTGGDVTDTNPGGAGNPNAGAPGAPGAPGTPAPQPAEFFNNQAEQLKLQAAQQAAYQAYLNERLRTIDQPGLELQKEQLAFQKATEAFNETMKTAEVSGVMANGQQTEAAKEFARKQALEEAQAAGIWNGQPTEQAREFNVGQQNQVATALLNLLGTLRGPESAFQQQAVINGMDSSGMSNAVKALLGRINQPLSQGNQANPVPVSLESLFRQALGGGTSGANGFTAPNGAPGSGGNFLASLPSMPDLNNLGDITRTLKGQGGDTSNTGFAVPESAGGVGAGTSNVANLYANNLPAPNQIVGRNFLRMDPDTQNFLMSAYNSAGYGTPQVQSAIKAGLPQFSAPKTGTLIY